MKARANSFFILADQYSETAKLLLETLIDNGNSNVGIGNSYEEAYKKMNQNVKKSDLFLFIPAIFNCLQSTELFIKGLLILKDIEFEKIHDAEKLLSIISNEYGSESEVSNALNSFYKEQISIIAKYKELNKIESSHDLYMSLRYPEIYIKSKDNKNKEKVKIDYTPLMYNRFDEMVQFDSLLQQLLYVKNAVLKVYHSE